MVNMQQAISILQEFVADVDAVGIDLVRDGNVDSPTSWPDLADTYDKAKQFLKDAGHEPKSRVQQALADEFPCPGCGHEKVFEGRAVLVIREDKARKNVPAAICTDCGYTIFEERKT